jgi:hypothetical protein
MTTLQINTNTLTFTPHSEADEGTFYISNRWVNGCDYSINGGSETHLTATDTAVTLNYGDKLTVRITNEADLADGWLYIDRPIIADRTESTLNTRFVDCLRLPDTSNITTVGEFFFARFNQSGALTSLPAGSPSSNC